jgi:hypothetical protein
LVASLSTVVKVIMPAMPSSSWEHMKWSRDVMKWSRIFYNSIEMFHFAEILYFKNSMSNHPFHQSPVTKAAEWVKTKIETLHTVEENSIRKSKNKRKNCQKQCNYTSS